MALAISLTPVFRLVRTQSGAVTIDSTTNLTVSAFALSELIEAGSSEEILIYWTADGVTLGDTITFRPIHYDAANTRYVLGATTGAMAPETARVVATGGAPCFILVQAKSTAATNLKIYAAAILPAPTLGGAFDLVGDAMQSAGGSPMSVQELTSGGTAKALCGHPIWTVFTITVPLTVNLCPKLTGTACPIDTVTLDTIRCPRTTMPGVRCGSDACCTESRTTCRCLITRGTPGGC